jgi:hypothetical protein
MLFTKPMKGMEAPQHGAHEKPKTVYFRFSMIEAFFAV